MITAKGRGKDLKVHVAGDLSEIGWEIAGTMAALRRKLIELHICEGMSIDVDAFMENIIKLYNAMIEIDGDFTDVMIKVWERIESDEI